MNRIVESRNRHIKIMDEISGYPFLERWRIMISIMDTITNDEISRLDGGQLMVAKGYLTNQVKRFE